MPTAGIEKLYAARLTSDSAAGLIYDTPRYLPLVTELSIKPKYNSAPAYAENRMVDQASEFDSAEIGVNRYEMRSNESAYLLGQDIAAAGGVIDSSGDEAPNTGILYRAPLRRKATNGIAAKRYGIIYKTQFNPPNSDMKSLQGKPDLSQVPQLSGKAQPTEWSYANTSGQEKHPWEYHVDSDDPNCPKDIDTTWFKGVYIPGIAAVPVLTLVSSDPVAGSAEAATSANPKLTFSNSLSNYGGIVLLKASDNSIVDVTLSLDSTGKIVTATPNATLAANTAYLIVISGVTDIYGQECAASTVKFTTAAG